MAKISTTELTRVNMHLPSKLVERVKEYAESLGLPYTQAYTVLLDLALQQKDAINQLPTLIGQIDKLQKLNDDMKM